VNKYCSLIFKQLLKERHKILKMTVVPILNSDIKCIQMTGDNILNQKI
jgi:hypothetical protein